MIRATVVGALSFLVFLAPGGLTASTCPDLFVPEGYEARCDFGNADTRWMLSVRPVSGELDPLSLLTIRPVEEEIDEPSIWLREQLTLDTAGMTEVLREGLRDEEVQRWVPPALFDVFEDLTSYARALDQAALRDCDHADWNAKHSAWEMTCGWEVGPLHQTALLRLVERGDRRIAVTAWASTERRLRHLTAIANGL